MPEDNDRTGILQGAGDMIFELVRDRATPKQWAEWLRVPLEHAAGTADYELVERLLEAGANGGAGRRGCDGNTLLHAGVEGGSAEVVSALIAAGAGQDLETHRGGPAYTPLHLAVVGGKEAATKVLVLAGADVNAHRNGTTPLYLAIKHGHLGVAEILLSDGADANIQSPQGAYPIHLATCGGYDGLVAKILQCGATCNCLDAAGKTPLRLAALAGHASTVKILLAGSGSYESNQSPTLHMAAYTDDASAIPALVSGGADVEARSDQYLTPLFLAAYLGSCSALLALLQAGAEVNTTAIDGSTPLHAACCRGDTHMAELLLQWGADATATDERGETPCNWIPSPVPGSKEKRKELNRLPKLLAVTACRERAWRRRGYLVMCRAYPSRRRALLETLRASDECVQPPRRSSHRVSSEAGETMEVEGASEEPGGGAGGTKTGDDEFGGVVAWLMELDNENEGAFRRIVTFL